MYIECPNCKCKHFMINVVTQVNGNDDTAEYICVSCGNVYDGFMDIMCQLDNLEETYCESEIDKVEFKNGTIKFEKWIVDGDSEYVVSLYRGDILIADRDFSDEDDAKNCYEKCSAIFLTCGDIEKVSRLFYDC